MTEKKNILDSMKGFSKPFWVVNTLELFERGAYYGMMAVLARHMDKNLDFSSEVIGALFAILLILLYFVPIVAAALAEKYGYKQTLIVAFVLMVFGYYISFFMEEPIGFVFTILLFGIGAGAFKPIVSATVAHVTTMDQRNLGYSIYYWIINLGAFLVPLVFSFIFYESIYQYAFLVAGSMMIVNIIITVLIFDSPVALDKDKSLNDVMKGAAIVLSDRRFTILLLIYSGFWFMFAMNQSFLPLYLKNFAIMPDWYQTTHLAIINPGTIICLGPFLGKRVERFDSLKMMVVGMSIFVVGFATVGFVSGVNLNELRYAIFVLAIIVFSIGEFITHPNFISYTSKIAPKDKVAIYMGFIFVPIGLGQVTGSFVGGFLYGHFAEDMRQPQIFWAIYCSVGLLTIVGMILYHRRFGAEMNVLAQQNADQEEILDAESAEQKTKDDTRKKEEEKPLSPLAIYFEKLWKPVPLVGAVFVAMILLLAAAAASPKLTFYEDEDEKKGIYLWQANVNHTTEELFDITQTVFEGDSVEGEGEIDSLHIFEYVVEFSWSAQAGDVTDPEVRLEVWSSNESREQVTLDDSSLDGTMTVNYVINNNTHLAEDGITQAKAMTTNELVEKFEMDPETVYVVATYVADNNPIFNEQLDFTITISVTTWELEDIVKAPR